MFTQSAEGHGLNPQIGHWWLLLPSCNTWH